MSEDQNAAEMAGDDDLLPGEDMKFGQTAEPDPKPEGDKATETAEQPADGEGESSDEGKPKRESAKERRERDKAYKERLRSEAEQARAALEAAERRRAQIMEAGSRETEPKESDFADYTEYVAAKAVWQHASQAAKRQADEAGSEAEQARQRAQAIQDQERALLAADWERQSAEAKGRYADFTQVVEAPGLFPKGNHLPDLIVGSENAADLAYAVAKDRALHDRLVGMHPWEAARELGRVEASLSAPKPRLETSAPEPITPVRPKASASVNPAKMPYADYVAARKAGRIK